MPFKKLCSNFNHSRSYITIKYCPQCGEKFNSTSQTSCDLEKHQAQRKDRNSFCVDCGKSLKIDK